MTGEITAAIKRGLRKSAKEVLEHTDELKKTAKNAEEAKQIDEVIEHMEDVAELDYLAKWDIPTTGPGGKGFLGGKKLGRKEIRQWIKRIEEISNGKAILRIVDETSSTLKGGQAGFDPFKIEIFVKKGVTEYELFHEFKNLEEFMKIGKDEYIKGWKFIGGTPEQHLIRQYKREIYVYNEILKESKKFNKEQLKHAFEANIEPIIKELEDSGIDITKNIK